MYEGVYDASIPYTSFAYHFRICLIFYDDILCVWHESFQKYICAFELLITIIFSSALIHFYNFTEISHIFEYTL